MTPSPFELGRSFSTNIGNVQERQTDLSAIDQILSNAAQTGQPGDLDSAINQILTRVSPARQKGALDILQNRQKRISDESSRQTKLQDQSNLETRKQQGRVDLLKSKQDIKQEEKEEERTFQAGKDQEKRSLEIADKNQKFEGALSSIDEMRKIGKKGNLGFSFTGNLGPETRKDRAKYSQIAKSLITFVSSMNIRNQKEFDEFAKDLTDPTLTDATRDGILEGMEDIINRSIQENNAQTSSRKKLPPLGDALRDAGY